MTKKPTAPAPTPATRPQRRTNHQTWIVSGVLGIFAVVLLIAGSGIVSEPAPVPKQTADQHMQPKSAVGTGETGESSSSGVADSSPLIADDGQTLWATPTAGPPLDLAYLPPGVQIIVALRPKEILEHPEGEKTIAALGPLGKRGVEYLEQMLGAPLRDINRLLIGGFANADGSWSTTLVALFDQPQTLDNLRSARADSSEKSYANQRYMVVDDRAYCLPDLHDGVLLVIAPATLMPEIIDLAASAPPLRRDMECLVAHTDADRQVTLLVAPNFLFGEGQGMFSGEIARLREALFWFLGDEFSAAGLSLHWGDNFFVEVLAVPTLETLPERASQILAERVAEMPDYIEEYALALHPSEYSRRVVARFPEMVRKLAAYTRRASDRDVAMLRCYLPAIAGHNLLMAAELTLAEKPSALPGPSSAAGGSTPSLATPARPSSVAERLQRKTSLRFARDTLEAALDQLSTDIGIEIIILGPDLQLEGITKNQSFGIDLVDRPAEEILVEVLRQANPDKTAAGPVDPRQRLVYVVRPQSPAVPEAILITTRSRAMERGDTLPAIFAAPTR